MPHPIPVPVRQVIVQRAQQGQSAGLIARCLGLVPRTVRQLLQRLRMQGQNALVASYPSRSSTSYETRGREQKHIDTDPSWPEESYNPDAKKRDRLRVRWEKASLGFSTYQPGRRGAAWRNSRWGLVLQARLLRWNAGGVGKAITVQANRT